MITIHLQKELLAANGQMQLDINLNIEQGELIALYGNSGAGKTSIIRMIAGLMQADEGQIIINQKKWYDNKERINLKTQERKIGFLFQDYALFPNMTVEENLLFALEKNQNRQIVQELIDLMELGDLKNRKPNKLSGGQQQRVALARALVRKPELLMLDEPLSALDAEMRSKLQDYILRVHQEFNLTTILVSHDVGEVIKMANRIFIIENGKISKQGNPIDVFSSKKVSGKFQFSGEIINIQKEDVIYIVTILIGANIVKIVAEEMEVNAMNIGDKVMVASKAFNPVLRILK